MSALRSAVIAVSLALAGAPAVAPMATAAPATVATSDAATAMQFHVVIRTEGLSDYRIARDEVAVGRRAHDLGLTVVDWHTGRGIVVSAPAVAAVAPLLDEMHVVSIAKLA